MDAVGIDVEPLEAAFCELCIIIVAFMLHTGGQGDHGEIVCVGDAVDVAREAEGERRQRDALCKAAASGGAFDIESRAAGGLSDGSRNADAKFAEPLDEAKGCRGLAFAERRGGDGGHVDVFTFGSVF